MPESQGPDQRGPLVPEVLRQVDAELSYLATEIDGMPVTRAELRAENERLQAEIEKLHRESKEDFIKTEEQLTKLNLQNGEIAEALVRLSTAISDDVKSTGPFKIDLHKTSRNLKDAMMHAVTIIQANGLTENRIDPVPHRWWCVIHGLSAVDNERCPKCGMP
jgi:regulator of replication initiation timing